MRDLTGTWRLVRTRAFDETGRPMAPPFGGEKAMGRVCLQADGRMMAVLVDGRAEVPAGVERAYSSYCGHYTFDGETLVTRVDAAADPARMGSDQVHKVRFEGELMVLQPPQRQVDGRTETRELFWEKIADV